MLWRPAAVVPEHKTRARSVWVGLLLLVIAYVIWQIWSVLEEMADPSANLTLSNDPYRFPYVMVCVENEHGCSQNNPSVCVDTALAHNGTAYVEYEGAIVNGTAVDEYPQCVGFDLPTFEVGDDDEDARKAHLYMFWIASPNASEDNAFTESVNIHFGTQGEDVRDFIRLPYSRLVGDSNSLELKTTDVTIGKTTTLNIAGDTTFFFPALTISTTEKIVTNVQGWNSTHAYGSLNLAITQGAYSLTEIEELNPLEIGTILGNIGGFWEILLVFWGVMFVTAGRESEPTLRARQFANPVLVVKEHVQKRRRLRTTPRPRDEHPHCEDADRASADTLTPGAQNQDFRQDGVSNNRRVRRPVALQIPQRYRTPGTPIKSPLDVAFASDVEHLPA